jgi:hypothetical protein
VRVFKYEIDKDRGWSEQGKIYGARGSGGNNTLWSYLTEMIIKYP